ncbi:MAG: glycoside hydrolase family 13 protein [Saprospiraceae bacterium]|nr:glycoside hydrolase family 13 protein [Saprospiraceae bacterium]MCF8250767.1 glycoside hydrolase family 13 protein [Saprospiraceae bacterium]MCF8282179.1 glycoside hydrolase family 13 protein [Bacteroidales bacterium]MCF8312568.1 glycoside hydrolase family 13 protein [Saprospiraceae bacterium]MCF8440897.1 glycoside hydrolase family 13 protein [Saprospiraceae bacterium]
MKIKHIISLFCCAIFSLIACKLPAQQGNIYDNNPEQRLPIGMEKAKHRHISANGGKVDKVRVEPPFWFTGMARPELEVLIYDQNIKDYEVSLTNAEGVKLVQVYQVENPNYLFVNLEIGPGAKPGKFNIILKKGTDTKTYPYELRPHPSWQLAVGSSQSPNPQSAIANPKLNASDFIYLVMPDRFSNGDPSNDSYPDMAQVGVNRQKMYFRHGGDIQGVMNHLEYFTELGVTALWLNPVMENNQPYESYHGYAVTDFYNIDKRFGSNELYKKLVDDCHARGIKVIMDIIFNHCGDQHWFIKDLPSEDWIHQWAEHTRPVYRGTINTDPYKSDWDQERVNNGWFDNHMPDLNQQNPRLATYLIQNTIWWAAYTGQDAYRIDTYYYPDQKFTSVWAKRMEEEFPGIGMFGEVWVENVSTLAYYTQNNGLSKDFNYNLPQVKDFPLSFALTDALTKKNEWLTGAIQLYMTLSQDFLYENPYRNVLFLDNHDLSRFYSTMGEDVDKLKAGYTFMMTTRGIPSLYYGTEILLTGYTNPDGKVRQDFPGGWPGDPSNKFTAAGRTPKENDAFNYFKKLANYRKANPVLHDGKLTQFVPEDGVYVYFRHNADKTVMCIMNCNDAPKTLPTQKFAERMMGFKKAKNVITDEMLNSLENIQVGRYTTLVLELQ